MEYGAAFRPEYAMTQLEQAQVALDWLPNYMFDWSDTIEELPALAEQRLTQLFGDNQTNNHLLRLKAIFRKIPAEHQANTGLYIAGYPDEAFEDVSEVPLEHTIELLRQLLDLQASLTEIDELTGCGEHQGALRVVATPSSDTEAEAHRLTRRLDSMTSREGVEWQDDALCAQTDSEMFFPEKGGSTRDAKKVCSACEVREKCLEYALFTGQRYGIWGGLSERERRRMSARGKRVLAVTEQNDTSETTS
jgi:WhiB family redox-sensing transcriptional regulator